MRSSCASVAMAAVAWYLTTSFRDDDVAMKSTWSFAQPDLASQVAHRFPITNIAGHKPSRREDMKDQTATTLRRGSKLRFGTLGIALVTMCAVAAQAPAQEYHVSWYTVDGGGTSHVSSGTFVVSGTFGQPDAHKAAADGYVLSGGYWHDDADPQAIPAVSSWGMAVAVPLTLIAGTCLYVRSYWDPLDAGGACGVRAGRSTYAVLVRP